MPHRLRQKRIVQHWRHQQVTQVDSEYMHITTKKDTINLIIIPAVIIIAEIGNAYLTYDWKPQTYITDGIDRYSYNDFYDAVGDIVLKLGAFIGLRIYVKNRWLKNIVNWYIECLCIDFVYSAFFNPFVYHLSKTNLVLMTSSVYVIQIVAYNIWKSINEKEPYPIKYKNNL